MDLDLEKIMEQMKAAKLKQQEEDIKEQEEIIVNIPKTKSGRGRGRPRGRTGQGVAMRRWRQRLPERGRRCRRRWRAR